MATFSSKQEKRQGLIDPILVLVSIALFGVLVALGPVNGLMYRSIHNSQIMQSGATGNVSIAEGTSFASDLRDWNANCSHGWTSDSTCDALVSRTQSCSVVGTDSAYCSEYDTYLQQFRGQ